MNAVHALLLSVAEARPLENFNGIHYQKIMRKSSPPTGTLFAIKRYAIHDGPDLRVTIFFKGCPLSCRWCHNPEGLDGRIAMHFNSERCVACGECAQHCPRNALGVDAAGLQRDSAICVSCGECVRVCPALAHEAVGRVWSVDEVVTAIEKDAPFFEGTRGGVTFSGGEPLAQPDFLAALLEACAERQWHRVVDTSGFAPRETLARIAPLTDLFLFDLKHMDSERHERFTGAPNGPILENARWLARCGVPLRPRFPFVPGFNDDEENIVRTGRFAASLGAKAIDLLPYHRAAGAKYDKLGLGWPARHIVPPAPEAVSRASLLLNDCGLSVRIGG